MFFKLMTLVHLCAAFPLKCPEPTQWRLRANSHCPDPSTYSCVQNDVINRYSENCTWSDLQPAGRKSVLRVGTDADLCSKERYQPSGHTLYTNASTNCLFVKTFCNEEGQVVYDPGDHNRDATCRCDYRRSYDFLKNNSNPCFCKPSIEDCSCFLKICSNSSHILSPDYECTLKWDLPPVTHCKAITDAVDNNGKRPDITETFPKEDNGSVFSNYATVPRKTRSAIALSFIFGCIIVMFLMLCMKRLWEYCFRAIFTSKFNPISCIEGERLQLKCSVFSKDIFVKWMKDDMEIEQNENLSIHNDGKDHFLTVQQAKLSDSGQYVMSAGNEKKQQTVVIKEMFTSDFNPVKCIEGEKLQLKCSVYLEDVFVEWFKGDVRINENKNISIENDGMHHCMTIQPAKLSDDGQYNIVAGNVRKEVTVNIQAIFTSELDPIKCIEGEKLQLKCSVYSEDVSVEWFKGDVRINVNENISIENDGMHHCMTIQQAKLSDDGQYKIVAGNVRKQVTVNIQAMFTSGFKQKCCIEGEMLQLTCSVISHNFHVDWFKDDEKIHQNNNIMINSDGMHHYLTIQQAKLSDAGQYILTAGNVSKQLTVNIRGRTKLEEAKQEMESSQKKALFNWKLLKGVLASTKIEDVSKQIGGKDLWDSIKHHSRRSQMDSILTVAIKKIETSADCDEFEAKLFHFNTNFKLMTPNNTLIPVDELVAKQLLPENTELIENELYPKDYIDSFLEWFIISLIEHEKLRYMENVRYKMANFFLKKIQLPHCIEKGSMHRLIDSFRRDDNKVLNRISELMEGALPNGFSNFTGDNTLKKIMETRNFCRHSIICKWTYLKENFSPLGIIVNLHRCGLVDEDRREIIEEKPRREMVDLTLRNIVRRIDGENLLSKLKDILNGVNLSLTGEQQDSAEHNRFEEENDCDVENVKRRLQTLENALEQVFDPNYIDTFLEHNVFDIDDHENIWESGSDERGKRFYEKISDIDYIKKGSIKCLAYCLENSEPKSAVRNILADFLTSEKEPEQEKKRTEAYIEPDTENVFSGNTYKLTQASMTIKTDPKIENAIFEKENSSDNISNTVPGQMEIEGIEKSSVIFHLQSSDGGNVKFVFEKSLMDGNLTSFIKNLLDDENVKKHMSPEKRYNLSVTIRSKDKQKQSYSVDKPKMRTIKANRKLLEEEYDPMSLLKAVFDGNEGNYKSVESLSPENVADFKRKFSEINKIPERRKRVKQFLNIAEDIIEADKLWDLLEDTANTFSMMKMRYDLNEGQNDISSSDEGLVFEGKYKIWKTEKDVKSPLQSFILEESKKKGIQHEDTMSNKDFKRSQEIYLPGMRNAYELESDVEKSLIKIKGPTSKSDVLYKSEEPVNIRQTIYQSNVSINQTLAIVHQLEDHVNNIQGTVHKLEVQGTKIQDNVHESKKSVNEPREIVYKLEEPRNMAQVHIGRLETQEDFTNLRQSQVAVTKSWNHDNKSMEVFKSEVCGTVNMATLHEMMASLINHEEIVKSLLDNKADIKQCRDKEDKAASPLHVACFLNNIEIVKVLLDNKEDINKCEDNRGSPLYIACQQNHIELVKLLLDNKADINKCIENGVSPLHVACFCNHIEVVKVLLNNKADINTCDDDGDTPLYIACMKNHEDLVKLLLDNKADINACKATGASPLTVACYENHIETVKILLNRKADINKWDGNGATALYITCQNNHKEIVKLLIDNKADINKCADNGASPLNVACQNDHVELVKVLLENRADINKCDAEGASALYMACQNNHKEVVKLLLDNKADINACDDLGGPLYIACQQNYIELVKILLDNKADINKCRANGVPPLNVACFNNHIETVKILLDNEADINKCDDNGATALYMASQGNQKEVVQLLLDNKADINKCTHNGASSLNVACQNNHLELVKLLLENKADINTSDRNGATPLYMASQNNHKDVVKLLLDNKADINAGNDLGGPLYIACQQNHIEVVKILLDNKADINKCRANGASPLNVACQNNHIETVKILLDNKADIYKRDDNGATALYMASQNNHKEVVQLLLAHNKADTQNEIRGSLHIASRNNHIDTFKILLDNKADINKCNGNGATALYLAFQNNHKE